MEHGLRVDTDLTVVVNAEEKVQADDDELSAEKRLPEVTEEGRKRRREERENMLVAVVTRVLVAVLSE